MELSTAKLEQFVKQVYDASKHEGEANKERSNARTITFGSGHNLMRDVRSATKIDPRDRYQIAKSTACERQNAYKKNYRTNLAWGGGSKEHPGKRRDSRCFSAENNNYRLSQERWVTSDKGLSRRLLLEIASEKHKPEPTQHQPIDT